MDGVRFYELLGVAGAVEATAVWPSDRVHLDRGDVVHDEDVGELMTQLQDGLRFTALRPGAAQPGPIAGDPVAVGVTAELHVENFAAIPPITLHQLGKVSFVIRPTHGVPAHLFVTRSTGGVEVAIHGLPVTILMPPGLLMPRRTMAEQGSQIDLPDVRVAPAPPPDGPIEGFDATLPDSLEIVLSEHEPSRITVRVNVRLTELGDFYFDTAVPISIGACRASGLPVKGLHDLQLIPTPAPSGVPRAHLDAELPLEWKRHALDLLPANAYTGLLAIRTVDLDMDMPPWSTWAAKAAADRAEADQVEFVLDDLVIPFFRVLTLPFPVHGRFGLRRRILVGDDGGERYHLDDAPVDLKLGPITARLFRVLLQTTDLDGEAPVEFDAAIQRTGAAVNDPDRWSFPVSFDEAGELIAGLVIPVGSRPRIFTAFGTAIFLAGVRIGVSLPEVKKLMEGGGSAASAFCVLVDLELVSMQPGEERAIAKLDTKGNPIGPGPAASSYFEDLGWRFGKPSFGSMASSTDRDLKLFDKLRLHIEDIGLVSEDNGGFYLSVSASLEKSFGSADAAAPAPVDPAAPPPPADAPSHGPCARTSAGRAEALARGYGVHLHRLRTRIAGDDDAPAFLLDGVSVFFSIGKAEISGFGALSEYDLPPGNHYSEVAVGLQVCFPLLGKNFDLGFEMYRGRVRGVDNFGYWLLGIVLGGLPIGSMELRGLRVLVVENLAPRLPAVDGTDQPMRLYRWYKSNLNAVELPQHRALTAWQPLDQSDAFGLAASVTFAGTKAVRFDAFFFQMRSPADKGLVGGLELYALKAPQPLAFAAFEWDDRHDKWGLTIGFNVGLEALFGNIASWLGELTIAGLLFFGNKPDTIAIGQYNDVTTWPSVRFQFNRWWKLEIFFGACFHRVDAADAIDPTTESLSVFGLIVSAKGTVKFGFGTIKLYFTLSWVSGQWRNEAVATGHTLIIEAGIRVRLFGCFNFAASVHVDYGELGPGPSAYSRVSTVVRIETPWWLPDVTVRWSSIDGAPTPEAMPLVSRPLIAASAIGPGPRIAIPIGVAGIDAAPTEVHALDAVRALPAPVVGEAALAALALVSCDSEIALDFKPSLDASATVVPGTPVHAGRQQSNELEVTYELVAIGIRRRRRYGETAGAWTDLVDPVRTELDNLAGLPPGEWEAAFQSAVGFDWDADVQRLGRLDPRRLLINAVTPYSFLSSNPEGDEVLAASNPGWPCCTPQWPKPIWHVVDFAETTVGARTPATERFTTSTSTLHWTGGRAPIVVPAVQAPAGSRVARIAVDAQGAGPIAIASFDEPARVCEVFAYWAPAHSNAQLIVDGYRGLALVTSQIFAMSTDDPGAPIHLEDERGLTSVVIRKLGAPVTGPTAIANRGAAFVEVVAVRYRTVADERRAVIERLRCHAQDQRFHGQGRLAWLPNSDYEVTIKTRATVAYSRSGAQDATMEQRAFFRTKGLPGLNAVVRIGEELESYVESVYPPPATTLYRREPIALAFNERFNVLAPIDRTPTAADPEERRQLARWVLATEEAGADGLTRLSQTDADWIVAHRGTVVPPRRRRPALLADVMTTPTRSASSLEPLRVRLDRMVTRPGGCAGPGTTLHTSQVLTHAPYDPEQPDATAARWPRGRTYRVDLRLDRAPFVERAPFEAADLTALAPHTATGTGATWRFDRNAVRAPAGAAGVQYALFGDADWDHVQVVAAIDPLGHAAGVAAAIRTAATGAVTRAITAVIDERSGAPILRVSARDGATVIATQEIAVPASAPRPFVLEVAVFDDVVRASVAGASAEVARGNLREGRMALVADGDGAITRLLVRGLDGYRFHVATSRYDGFAEHIGSFGGTVGVVRPGDLGSPTTTAAALLAATASEIAAAMSPGADTAMRDRLLAQWLGGLALPTREATQRLELTRHQLGADTGVILVESPEPLPLGGDVTVRLRRRRRIVPPFPVPPRPRPPFPSLPIDPRPRRLPPSLAPARRAMRPIEAWAVELDLDLDRTIAPALPVELSGARRLVTVVAIEGGATELRAFALRTDAAGTALTALALTDADRALRLGPGEAVLVDGIGDLVLTPFPWPPSPFLWSDVPVRVVTSSDARRALVIPTAADPALHAPLPAGTYQLVFTIDRARWRSATPDAASSYRATHILTVSW